MTFYHFFTIRHLITTAVLLTGLGHVTHTSADVVISPSGASPGERSFLIDLNKNTVTLLGTLGGDTSEALDLNDGGQVVGRSTTAAGAWHAFITDPGGSGMKDLGTLGGNYSRAEGINKAGRVVGQSTMAGGAFRGFITDPGGTGIRALAAPSGWESAALDINDSGEVGGFSYKGTLDMPFITGPNGSGITVIAGDSSAWAINNVGQMLLYSYTPGVGFHGFITGPDGMGSTDLGTLGGDFSIASDINYVGQAVGFSMTSTTAGGDYHAFITERNGTGMRDLGTLGGDDSHAYSINDAGQVVGDANLTTGERHAFVTGPNGADMKDLNSLVNLPQGVVLTRAIGINNHGQVIAVGVVPEPEIYALMLAGLVFIGFMVRRKVALFEYHLKCR